MTKTNTIYEWDLKKRKLISADDLDIDTERIIDRYGNYYRKFPDIYVSWDKKRLYLSLFPQKSFILIHPQQISEYKNSLINGQIRSIPHVAPNFNQLSFNKSAKFCKWVGGEHMSGITYLYLMLICIFTRGTCDNVVRGEDFDWDNERDCGFGDTGEQPTFCGLEQIICSGYNFIELRSFDKQPQLFELLKELLMRGDLKSQDSYEDIFGYFGGTGDDENALFYAVYDGRFGLDGSGDLSPRLCRSSEDLGVGKGRPLALKTSAKL